MYVLNECSNINYGGSRKPEKCPMKTKERKKRQPRKNFFDDRRDFVWLLQKLDITDVDELQVNNSSHTKGTICLVNGGMGAKRMVFQAWAHERAA